MLRQAVVLVGGRGTRLGELTADSSKPMLPIGDRPFLELLIDEISRHGIDELLLLCGYLGEGLVDRFDGTTKHGCRIKCQMEDAPAGTVGALRNAYDALAPEFLLLNGDSFFDINLLDLPSAWATRPFASGCGWSRSTGSRRTLITHGRTRPSKSARSPTAFTPSASQARCWSTKTSTSSQAMAGLRRR